LIACSLDAATLKEVLQAVLQNNTNIKAMNYDISAKKETLKSVSNTLNPTINIGANYNRLDLDVRSSQVGATTVGYMKFSADIYDGGKNSSIKRQKDFQFKSAKLNTNESTKEILLQAVTLFYQIRTVDENSFCPI